MSAQALGEPLQAFAQLIMAKKVMSDADAKAALAACYERFGALGFDFDAAISKVDKMFNGMDMGVRSMKATGPGGAIYHCFINKTADEVAKLHGSRLEDWQIKIFRGIIETIAESEQGQLELLDLYELTGHIKAKEPESSKKQMIKLFADQLVEDFWLARPGNNAYYRLGARAYVELPEMLKSVGLEVPQMIYH